MLMTIDVGNTNITVGIFDKQKLVGNFRLTTGMTRTSDEFGTAIGEILRYNDIEKQDISDAIIASVVPKIMHSLTSGIIKYFEVHPILVEPGVRTGSRSSRKIRVRSEQIVLSMPQAHWACMADRRSSLIMVRRPPMIWSVQRGHMYPV